MKKSILDKVYYKYNELQKTKHSEEIKARMMGEFVRIEFNEMMNELVKNLEYKKKYTAATLF